MLLLPVVIVRLPTDAWCVSGVGLMFQGPSDISDAHVDDGSLIYKELQWDLYL